MGLIGNFLLAVGANIGGIILSLFNSVFGSINYVIPSGFSDSITYFFSYFAYLRGVFPIDTLVAVFGTVTIAWAFVYSIKIFFMLFSMIPFIGKYIDLPGGTQTHIEKLDGKSRRK